MYKNVVGWCPICNQGWIRIVVDDDSNQLFCCCSECENEWNDPLLAPSDFDHHGAIKNDQT